MSASPVEIAGPAVQVKGIPTTHFHLGAHSPDTIQLVCKARQPYLQS